MGKTIDLLEEGMNEKIFRKMEPLIVYRMYAGAWLSVAQGEIEKSYSLSEETVKIILSALWNSLSVEDSYISTESVLNI